MGFQEVYNQHFNFVWRVLRSLGVPESDAADAAQDVFLVVYRKLDEFEGRSKITTWLFSICYRVASERRNTAYHRHEITNEALIGDRPDERSNPAQFTEQRQKLAILELALAKLPQEQRAVFVMFELEDMTSEEISESLSIPLGTVYSRLRLARSTFHKVVERIRARSASELSPGGNYDSPQILGTRPVTG
jgi:RNA polymerase sigma-70 factor, ECF subfamily